MTQNPYIHFGGRLFRSIETSGNSQVSGQTVFKYDQRDSLITATYSGGDIEYGQLIGIMGEDGFLDFRYHHVGVDGHLRTGQGRSEPKFTKENKLQLHEVWQWTSGDKSSGTSILEEI